MDTKMEIKEEDLFSNDIFSMNETEFFTKNNAMETNNDAVPLNDGSYITVKTEIKPEPPLPKLCSQEERKCFIKHLIKQIKPETVTSSNSCEVDTKTGIDSQKEIAFFPENPVTKIKKYNSTNEVDSKIEIKEEPWWMETETSFACDDIKTEDFTPVNSPRLCTEAVSTSSILPLHPTECSGNIQSFSYENDCFECESEESDVRKTTHIEKYVFSEQSGKSNNEKIASRALLIRKDKRLHRCSICNKNFTALSYLKQHNLIHEVIKPHKCDICEKSFTFLCNFKTHKLMHEGKKPYVCAICEKRFTQLRGLKRHNLTHEDKKPHKCEICEKSFTYLSNLKLHNFIHEGKKPHKCDICEKNFLQFSYLKTHSLIHEGKKPHQCDICGKSFTQLGHLKTHNLIHEGKKPFKCVICEKEFTQLSVLKRHNLIHEGIRPYKCEICGKSFTYLSHLKDHILIHGGTKPHKCDICKKSFNRLGNLKTHKLIHERKKPFNCAICEKRFTLLSALKRHILIHGGKKPRVSHL